MFSIRFQFLTYDQLTDIKARKIIQKRLGWLSLGTYIDIKPADRLEESL